MAFGGILWYSWDIFVKVYVNLHGCWDILEVFFLSMLGAFWSELRVFWWNFVMFVGMLGNLRIFIHFGMDLHRFGAIYADFWAFWMGFLALFGRFLGPF